MYFPLKNPQPDFEEFEKVLKGETIREKVHFAESSVDREVIEYISMKMMGKKLFYPEAERIRLKKIEQFHQGKEVILLTDTEEKIYMKHSVEFYYRMGYDYFPDLRPDRYLRSMILPKVRTAKDTATILPRKGAYYETNTEEGSREWAEEGQGIITSWEDFEKFSWTRISLNLENYYEFLDKNLPEGMKVMVSGLFYSNVLDRLLGHEGFYYLLYDDPKLIREVSNQWGKIVYDIYKDAISREVVGGIFHSDDLGHKTGTLVSPDTLREIFFPWFKKYARLAHEQGKMFWFHSCGNVLRIMEDLIEDVGIDAFHSFQDVIIPVTEFKKRYQDRIATLGGVDMDKLARLEGHKLRKYIRRILNECIPGGRYALGSGNSIANYIPVKNYLIMLEEGSNFGK